jgi:hypothetical protein
MLQFCARYAQELPVKALIASLVLVGSVAAGMLLLAGQYLAAPARQSRLATAGPATVAAVIAPSEIAELPTRVASTAPAILPTLTPAVAASLPTRTFAAVLPTRPAERAPARLTPTVVPTVAPSSREGCDPAYPDDKTCIPPGPPYNQGCVITEERRFTVLPPDPQRLDHDEEGIGCEPIS